MKRKLGVALLIVATALAGTPEALTQFHELNQALQHWAHTSLGGSFLVYAEGAGERALPDRYDYHQLAPRIAAAPPASSYGLMASLSLPAARPAHNSATCPATRRAVESAASAPRARMVETRTIARVERAARRAAPVAARDRLAREIERATTLAARALGTKLDAQQFAEIIKSQELDAKLKALRIRPGRETVRTRVRVPVRVARFDEEDLPFVYGFEPSAPLPLTELARRNNEDENRPGATSEEQSKRKGDAKTRKGQKPGARGDQRQFDVSPFAIMAAADADAKGFDCDGNDDNN